MKAQALNQKFLKDLEKYSRDIQATIENVVKSVVVDIVEVLVNNSTVGQYELWHPKSKNLRPNYKPGKFISSWSVSLNTPSLSTVSSWDTKGTPSFDSAFNAMQKFKIGDIGVAIVNTARNDQGEYYPILLETRTGTILPNWKKPLDIQGTDHVTYMWAEKTQDGVLAPTMKAVEGILKEAVRTVP